MPSIAASDAKRDVDASGLPCEGLLPEEVVGRFVDALARVDLNKFGAPERWCLRCAQPPGRHPAGRLCRACSRAQATLSCVASSSIRFRARTVRCPWHQDLTIAVKERIEVDGYGPWSVKADVQHVQPPAAVLEKMLNVRLHLDNCPAERGALRVLPGSHLYGKIAEEQISDYRESHAEHTCAVGLGGALLMRTLLLHASSPSASPERRRVIHLDFASEELDGGLQWLA